MLLIQKLTSSDMPLCSQKCVTQEYYSLREVFLAEILGIPEDYMDYSF